MADKKNVPTRRSNRSRNRGSLANFRREMNDVFDRFFGSSSLFDPFADLEERGVSTGRFAPSIDVSDRGNYLQVSADLPGMKADDIEVSIEGDSTLRLKGEKSMTKEEEEGDYYRSERSYGYFERRIPLPTEVDESAAEATYESGVLEIRLPKIEDDKSQKRTIEVSSK